jgi:transaldolase
MTKLHEATELGQSIWLDYIRRSFIESGELQRLIDDGLRGITSNPSIFEEAIGNSSDYDDAMRQLTAEGKTVGELYDALVIKDIQAAADLLRPVYDQSDGLDGYVSLEANPNLAYDVEGTIEEVHHLHAQVDRPNVMFKIPATTAGIPAIATLISEGIPINVTLIFSLKHYEAVADAYVRGIERRALAGDDVSHVASVASFFISRVDTVVDKKLQAVGNRELTGQIGVANAKMAYARYLGIFSSERWQQLEAKGAHAQRILFGSTSVKNPDYPDTFYVDNLMGANTVNTLPRVALDALRDHGVIASGLTTNLEQARQQLNQLAALGIDLDAITQALQDKGVHQFATSFSKVSEAIAEKAKLFKRQTV